MTDEFDVLDALREVPIETTPTVMSEQSRHIIGHLKAKTKPSGKFTLEDKAELIKLHSEMQRRQKVSGYANFFLDEGPLAWDKYRRHIRFFNAGNEFRERVFMAGNRTGKTIAGAYEIARHAAGQYPDWWEGKRYNHGVSVWVAGDSNQTTRDIIQRELLGEPGQLGTGMIPLERIIDVRSKPGIPNAIEVVRVQHISGDISTIGFKSYEQGRASFQGTAKHVIWLDEEPPQAVYNECLMRTAVSRESPKGGMMLTTFTPLEGWTPFITNYLSDSVTPEYGEEANLYTAKKPDDNSRFLVQAGIDHSPHLDPESINEILSQYSPTEQKARREGIPSMGAGQIYPVPESDYLIDPIPLQRHWKKVYALDVGWNNTAALWGAWDVDTDTVYIYSEYFRGKAEPEVHSAAIKYKYTKGGPMRGVVDPNADNRSQADGMRLLQLYREQGLKLTKADNGVESGITAVWSRLSTGRIKVFNTCHNFLKEIRMYRRNDDGKVIKEHDHIMDCLRYLIMTGLHVAQPDPVQNFDKIAGAVDYGV